MVFPWRGRKLAVGLAIAVALLLVGLVFWLRNLPEGGSRVEGSVDEFETSPGVLQPVVGKLEYRPREEMVGESNRLDGDLDGEAKLLMVDNGEEAGRAIREFKEGPLRIDIAVKLLDVAEGKFYEAWLVMREPGRAYFSLGVLKASDDGFGLKFENGQDMPLYDGIVLTEESEDNGRDGIPERLVAEGVF